jgi:hypothetical protein
LLVWADKSVSGDTLISALIHDDILAIEDEARALAATPPAPALDVERLGHALMANDDSGSGLTPYYWHLQAVAIAREYAALAPERQ